MIGRIGRRVARCEDEDSAAEPAIASLTSLVLRDYLVLFCWFLGADLCAVAGPIRKLKFARARLKL